MFNLKMFTKAQSPATGQEGLSQNRSAGPNGAQKFADL